MRMCRRAKNYSLKKLEKLSGVNANTINLWENDWRAPNVSNAICVADALGVTIDEYVRGTKTLSAEPEKILKDALGLYGVNHQTLICIEELSTLQKALSKSVRGERTKTGIAQELADAQLAIEQMIIAHDCAKEVGYRRHLKLQQKKRQLEVSAYAGFRDNH